MFDWGPLDITDEETADFETVSYITDQLERDHDKPFFLAAGIYRPHLPWHVPQEYFDRFPLEDIKRPAILENDLDDLGPVAKELIVRGGNYHKHVVEAGEWEKGIQGYLASISYADAMVGHLLDALENSPLCRQHYCRHLVRSRLAAGREATLAQIRPLGKRHSNGVHDASPRRSGGYARWVSSRHRNGEPDFASGYLSDSGRIE